MLSRTLGCVIATKTSCTCTAVLAVLKAQAVLYWLLLAVVACCNCLNEQGCCQLSQQLQQQQLGPAGLHRGQAIYSDFWSLGSQRQYYLLFNLLWQLLHYPGQ